MRVPAPAKINLHLRVGPRRADGFHPLLTWMTTVGLFDTLTLVRRSSEAPGAATPRSGLASGLAPDLSPDLSWFSLSCSDPGLPVDGSNLVTRAATALADALSRDGEASTAPPTPPREGVSAFLTKRVPSGAGLGGGSSDAAATLIGLNRLWKLNWPKERLARLAENLGSDVPFFLNAAANRPSSVCTGRGEHVRPIGSAGISGSMKWAVLVTPPFPSATPDVYRRFDAMGLGSKRGSEKAIHDEPDWASWTKLSSAELMPRLVNDLEPAAFALRPELGELRAKLEGELSQVVRMSGSGSSLFSLCDDAEKAESQAKQVRDGSGGLNVSAIAVSVAPQMSDADSAI